MGSAEISCDDISAAFERIASEARRTPLVLSEPMSERTGATITLKAEHHQRTGSFKLRGALNKVLGLDSDDALAGVIAASSGNHGIGVATAALARGAPSTVFLPSGASPSKVRAIERLGAEIVTVDGTDTALAEAAGRAAATERGLTYISPYNDPDIIAGQGTIGLEITEQIEAVDAVVVAVGGGGLISGIGTWVKERWPDTELIGASAANDRAMAASVAAGSIIDPPALPTFSDGTAGALESEAVTFPLCRRLVDSWIDVPEIDIARSVAAMVDDHHELVEGAAGVALAAAERHGRANPGASIVVVVCGANVSSDGLRHMLTFEG